MGRPKPARFDVSVALDRIREAVRPFPKAALFQLAADGHASVFEQLVACVISVRTLDEVTLPAARRLFTAAPTPAAMEKLAVERIDELIRPSTFHGAKAPQLHALAARTAAEFGGVLPCDRETLLSFRGVGPKCANLVLGIACGQPCVSVDVHVHRVVNRWGYVETPTPERTMLALHERLPREHWIELNSLLVPFGKHVCTGRSPRCSACPVRDVCRRVGVTDHR